MKSETIGRAALLGAISGMRTFSGPVALNLRLRQTGAGSRGGELLTGGLANTLLPIAAVGELVSDKLPNVPDRIEALPLGGRAAMGAVVGGIVAAEEDGNVLLGGLIGALAAIATAHAAYHARKQLPVPAWAGGLIEDGIVISAAALAAYADD